MNDRTRALFAALDEPVTLAGSSAPMLATREDGRVVGFGCVVSFGAEADVVIGTLGAGRDGARTAEREV